MINAIISGRLLKTPVVNTGRSGNPYCTFLLSAVTDGGEETIVSAISFADMAERISRLEKGDAVSIAGSLKPSSWTDRKTGEVKHGLNITVSACLSVHDAPARKKAGAKGGSGTDGAARPESEIDEGIPF